MGRNPISNTAKTDRPLRIRLTDEERNLLNDAAKKEKKPTSSWARETLIEAANRLTLRRPPVVKR